MYKEPLFDHLGKRKFPDFAGHPTGPSGPPPPTISGPPQLTGPPPQLTGPQGPMGVPQMLPGPHIISGPMGPQIITGPMGQIPIGQIMMGPSGPMIATGPTVTGGPLGSGPITGTSGTPLGIGSILGGGVLGPLGGGLMELKQDPDILEGKETKEFKRTDTIKNSTQYLYKLIVRQLIDDGYKEIADVVSRSTKTEVDPGLKVKQLAQLVKQSTREEDAQNSTLSVPSLAQGAGELGLAILDDDSDLPNFESKPLPDYQTRFITAHKAPCRIARFSQDGQFVATGSSDYSIKLLQVAKMHYHSQVKGEKTEDYLSTRPVIRTFYDNQGSINDLDFHPIEPFIASASKDCTIRFFDHSKLTIKRSYRQIYDSHNVRSIQFHPTGDFLLVGTDHPIIRLYDVNTFQAFVCNDKKGHHAAPINQVRYASKGDIFASASKDGSIKIWDGVTNKVVNTIKNAHSGAEVSSVQFSPSTKYLLSGGMDSTARLWELSTGKQVMCYLGAVHRQFRLQTVFSTTGDHVISSDELSCCIVSWDTRTGELVTKLSGHTGAVRYIAVSPTEPAFVSCSEDNRARFWAASMDD